MVGRRAWGRRIGGQSVDQATVGGDLVQIQNLIIDGARPVERVMARLAEETGIRLRRETGRRDVWRPAPLSVKVRSTILPVEAPAEFVLGEAAPEGSLPLQGELAGIAELFQSLPLRRLVVLVEPGGGKTVLAMLLILDLLRERGPADPVPVFFPLSAWNHKNRLDDWMVARLQEDFPFLARRGRRGMARKLIETGRILPVLDGLDEVVSTSSAEVVRSIDRVFTDRMPYVLTCRTKEFAKAIADSGYLSRAAIVEIEPVTTETAVAYLRGMLDGDRRWSRFLDRLRAEPDGPPAAALATPLMLYLLRTTYEDAATDPAELFDESRFDTPGAVEEHLLDAFVPAAYAPYHGLPYRADRARRWLATLASGPRDLQWWNLTSGEGGQVYSAAAVTIAAGWIFYLLYGPVIAFIFGPISFFIYVSLLNWLIVDRVEVITRERQAGVRAQLRFYRILAAFLASAAGAVTGALLGVVVSDGLSASATTVQVYAVCGGLLFGTTTLLSTPWGAFFATRLGLALGRRLPLRLLRFLEDAHHRGVLRQPGTAYQFRHARLQDQLASGPSPFGAMTYRVSVTATSGPRTLATLLVAPLLRLILQIALIVVPAVLMTLIPMRADLHFKSGARPEFEDARDCAPSGGCIGSVYWRWVLPPGGRLSARVSVVESDPFTRSDFKGFLGSAAVKECAAASVEMSVTAGRSAVPSVQTVRAGHPVALKHARWRIPKRFGSFTLVLRRLDTTPCTAKLEWEDPSLTLDQVFHFKSHFG